MRRLVLAALTLFVTSAAAAPGQGIAVLEVSAPPNMQGLASQMTRQLLEAAHAQGLKVVPPEEVETFLGPKNALALKQCGPTPGCLSARLADLPVNRAVVGMLARDDSHYLVHLWLIALSPPGQVAEVDRAILIASRRLQSDVAAALPGLLRGEQEAKGTLVLDSTVPHADVTLDGEAAGQTPLTRILKPGKHEVRVSHTGFYAVERLVTVNPGQTTRDTVRLLAIPGTEPLALPLPPSPEPETAASGGGLRVPVAGWVALGAAVAAGGAGAFLAVASHNNETELLAGYNPARNSYQGFRSQAVTGQHQALWANVCFGIAGAGLLTFGALTWITSASPAAPRASLGVGAGPQGAVLSLSGSF
jgi:PEGA domain